MSLSDGRKPKKEIEEIETLKPRVRSAPDGSDKYSKIYKISSLFVCCFLQNILNILKYKKNIQPGRKCGKGGRRRWRGERWASPRFQEPGIMIMLTKTIFTYPKKLHIQIYLFSFLKTIFFIFFYLNVYTGIFCGSCL